MSVRSEWEKQYDKGYPAPEISKNECNCGAIHTSFPDHHYDWCAAYKEKK